MKVSSEIKRDPLQKNSHGRKGCQETSENSGALGAFTHQRTSSHQTWEILDVITCILKNCSLALPIVVSKAFKHPLSPSQKAEDRFVFL